MKRILNIICVLFVVSSLNVFGQTRTTISDRHQCLLKTIQLLEDYEYYSVLDDADMIDGYLGLFENRSALVFNDLMGLSDSEVLSVDDYVKIQSTQAKIPSIKLKNIYKESITHKEDVWNVVVSFQKEMTYTDVCGTLIDSKELHKGDYNLRAYITYNASTQSCKIAKIEIVDNQINRLSTHYSAVQSSKETAELDKQLLYNKQPLHFNSYGQALFNEELDPKKLIFKDPDISIVTSKDCEHLVKIAYKVRRLRLKLHYDLGMGAEFSLNGTNDMTSAKSSGSNIGVDFGYVFPSKSKFKIGFFTGLGISTASISLGYENPDYNYYSTNDVDGDRYVRHYRDLRLEQKAKMSDLNIPVYFDFDMHFSSSVSMYLDLGVKANLNMGHKIDDLSGSAYVNGEYEKYGIILDEHWGYNGFGEHKYTTADLINTDLLDVNGFTADLLAGAGLRVNIPSTALAVDLGVSYQSGLMDVIKSNRTSVMLGAYKDNSHALIYNEIKGLNSTERVRNLTEALNSVKRNALKFNIGLTYKF